MSDAIDPTSPTDRTALPDQWRERLLPRRGRDLRSAAERESAPGAETAPEADPGSGAATGAAAGEADRPVPGTGAGPAAATESGPDLDPEAASNVAAAVAANRGHLVAALERPGTNPALARAGLAHLGGEPDPLGAAAVTTLLRFTDRYRGATYHTGEDRGPLNRELLTALVQAHGLPFAASAFIEDLGIGIEWPPAEERGPGDLPCVVPGDRTRLKRLVETDRDGPLPLLRALIAATGPDEYRRVVTAAEAHRTTVPNRRAAAIVLPDETGWVTEACEDNGAGHFADPLLWSAVSRPEHAERLGGKLIAELATGPVLAELVVNLGADALPVFERTLKEKRLDFKQRALVYEALALLPADDAPARLVARAAEPEVLAGLKLAAVRDPLRFARAVAARADSAPGELARLTGALRRPGVPLDDTLKRLPDDERAVLERLLAEAAPPVAERLPAALVDPPWTVRKRRTRTDPLDLESDTETVIVWAPGEYERAMALEPDYASYDPDAFWANTGDLGISVAEGHWGRLARGGAAVAGALVERMRSAPRSAAAIVPIRSPEAAALAADWFARLKSARALGADWLDRHGEAGAALLVPIAFGPDDKLAAGARAALRHLAGTLGREAVRRAAEPYGPEALERVTALADTDPRLPLTAAAKPGAWADPAMLPPVLLRSGEALPHATVAHLVAALAHWSPRLPFPGVHDFAEHCEPASLQRFSLALFDLWLRSGAPSKDSWAVDQLGAFGGDDAVAVLAPHIRKWPNHSQVDRALVGLEVIGRIGTDAAFRALRAADRGDSTTSVRARELAARLAAARGTTVERLADRLVPDHGITDPATLVLDYGPRRFHIAFDTQLTPHLTDDTGRPRPRLPKPGARDDARLAKAAIARFKALDKDVAATAEAEIARFERAMYDGRTFTLADLRGLDAHPITGAFLRRLVWFSRGAGFRIAEDGGFADVHDRVFEPDDAIRIAHPALLREATPDWRALFEDYLIIQPFGQLDRPAHRFTDDELATGRLARFDGTAATFTAIGDRLAWATPFTSPEERLGRRWVVRVPVPGGFLQAEASPEPDRNTPDPDRRHTLTAVRLNANRNRRAGCARPLPGSALDPVAAAELLDRLMRLAEAR